MKCINVSKNSCSFEIYGGEICITIVQGKPKLSFFVGRRPTSAEYSKAVKMTIAILRDKKEKNNNQETLF